MNKFFTFFISFTVIFSSCAKDGVENSNETEVEQPGTTVPEIQVSTRRMLWASINSMSNASYHPQLNDKILVSWRMFPTDPNGTAFDLYRSYGNKQDVKLNTAPITHCTNFVDETADKTADITYRLCYAGSTETLDTYTMSAAQASAGLPYISIPLASTADVDPRVIYVANDASIGDLDGDGEYEIIIKRLATFDADEDQDEDDEGGSIDVGLYDIEHMMLLEAYKLDGTFLWRVCMGPNILPTSAQSFAVYDFDGDGRCEIAIRTSEGTRFADGTSIGDTNGDGKTDYRDPNFNYIPGGPEFLSVIDGATGRELARTDYIQLISSETWGDSYFKRSSSYRISLGKFSNDCTSILICRGVYAKSVLEAWDFRAGKLTKRWRFDTSDGVHTYYAGQGNHSLSIGDIDGDGFDEIVYGACTIDHNGKGLNNSRLGHGDALHLGKFDPQRKGLQIWSCFETGAAGAALRDARTGNVLWQYTNFSDVGRALVADIDPDSPGCEMWWYQGNAHSANGQDLGYKPPSCNMAIWFSGSLNRQMLNGTAISALDINKGNNDDRIFYVYRYDVKAINGTKQNPCFYGDITGDWREEVIYVTKDNTELRIFSTWYPCDYKFPYLMSDHVYEMSAINQNVGYNQPTQLGYYLGSDLLKGNLIEANRVWEDN